MEMTLTEALSKDVGTIVDYSKTDHYPIRVQSIDGTRFLSTEKMFNMIKSHWEEMPYAGDGSYKSVCDHVGKCKTVYGAKTDKRFLKGAEVKVDWNKLMTIIRERGYKSMRAFCSEAFMVARSMGIKVDKDYLSHRHTKHDNTVPEEGVRIICAFLKIDFSEIDPYAQEEKPALEATVVTQTTGTVPEEVAESEEEEEEEEDDALVISFEGNGIRFDTEEDKREFYAIITALGIDEGRFTRIGFWHLIGKMKTKTLQELLELGKKMRGVSDAEE